MLKVIQNATQGWNVEALNDPAEFHLQDLEVLSLTTVRKSARGDGFVDQTLILEKQRENYKIIPAQSVCINKNSRFKTNTNTCRRV